MQSERVLEKVIAYCESIVRLENKMNSDDHIEVAEEILKLIKSEK